MACSLRSLLAVRTVVPAFLVASLVAEGALAQTAAPGPGTASPTTPPRTAAPAPIANAEPNAEDKALARELGVQGFELFDAGKYEQAAERFQRALALYDAPTLRLARARALMRTGRLVAASEEYRHTARQQATAGEPAGFAEARASAQAELDELLPRLAQLTVVLVGENGETPTGWTLEVDGQTWSPQALGVERPFDPGTHTIVVTNADGKKQERRITLAGGASERVTIQVAAAGEPATAVQPTPPPKTQNPLLDSNDVSTEPAASDNRALIAGVATIALTVGAVVTGLVTLSKRSEFEDENRPDVDQAKKEDLRDSAQTWAWINTGLSVAAVAGAGLTFYYWSDDPSDATDARARGVQRAHAWGVEWSTTF